MNKQKICVIGMVVSTFLLFPSIAIGEGFFIFMLITLVTFLVLTIVFGIKGPKEAAKCVDYRENDKKVILKKRDIGNADRLLVDKFEWAGSTINPATATFTAVTVGGVTTGGVDVRGPSVSPHWEKTEKYQIHYRLGYGYQKQIVNAIVINNQEDIAVARNNSTVSKFLQGDTLVLKHDVKFRNSGSQIQKDMATYGMFATELYKNELIEMQLTYSEAKSIVDFCCGR